MTRSRACAPAIARAQRRHACAREKHHPYPPVDMAAHHWPERTIMEDRKLEISDDLLLVRPMDTALVVGAPCAHGDQPHLLALHACTPSQTEERPVDTLWPRCALADVVGAVLADIRLTEGQEAAQRFRDNIDAAAAKYYEADAHTADDACCEASRRTRGREHTCGQNEEAP